MSVERVPTDDPRLMASAYELRNAIAACYPDATFEITQGDDPPGLYLVPTVDVDDTDDVVQVVAERLLTLQIDDELPIYVFPVRPLSREIGRASCRERV